MMKKRHRQRTVGVSNLAWAAMAVIIGMVVATGLIAGAAGVIHFPDPGLEAAVREALNKPAGEITDQELLGITTLDARYHKIANIEGIEYLVNLTELDLYGNQIVDISPLSGLSKLTTLILTRNEVADISPLSTLTSLAEIQLRNNQICDIEPLVNNPDFARDVAIALSFNPLPLQLGSPVMRNIEALQGRGARIVFAPIVVFPDAGVEAAIREAIGKPTEDILDADVVAVTALSARYRGISNLEGLEYCVNLTELDLSGNDIVEIDALAGLTKLAKLALENNDIISLGPLSDLSNLTQLSLNDNQIADLGPLSGLSRLTTLYLWNNEIVDLAPLSELRNLTGLYLYFNRIVDITPLANLQHLTGLGLSWNQIIDLAALSGLTSLSRLYLDHNQIVDISPLVSNAGLDQDDIVHLQENPLPLEPGSPALHDMQVLRDRGVAVDDSAEE